MNHLLQLQPNQNLSYDLSPQRLQDKGLAKNETLDFLIQDLFSNMTVSLMGDPVLAQVLSISSK
jgi:hypothetical protein